MLQFWVTCSTSRYPFARFTSNITKILGFVWIFIALIMVLPNVVGILDGLVSGAYYSTAQALLRFLSVVLPLIWGIGLAAGAEIVHSFLDCGDNSFKQLLKSRF